MDRSDIEERIADHIRRGFFKHAASLAAEIEDVSEREDWFEHIAIAMELDPDECEDDSGKSESWNIDIIIQVEHLVPVWELTRNTRSKIA